MPTNIEGHVAATILQQPTEIRIGDKTYSVAPPSVATMILVSEHVAKLPAIKFDEKSLVEEVLRSAKDCRALGDIAAILVLGAKGLTERVTQVRKVRQSRFFGLIKREVEVAADETVNRQAELAREILETLDAAQLYSLVVQCLNTLKLADFFGLTTFLCEINLTKPTKVD